MFSSDSGYSFGEIAQYTGKRIVDFENPWLRFLPVKEQTDEGGEVILLLGGDEKAEEGIVGRKPSWKEMAANVV